MPSIQTASASPSSHSSTRRCWLALGAWFALALIAAALGTVSAERRFAIPPLIVSTVTALVLAYRRSRLFRAFAQGLDLRWLLALHSLRAPIGAAFLWLMGAGMLTAEFAELAGYGDIAAGLSALALIPLAPFTSGVRRALLATWNVLALADISAVVLTAQRILLVRGEVEAMSVLLRFPGPMLPLFVVPLVIATHLLVLARLRA